MLEHAIRYQELGYSVIPLNDLKRPRIGEWGTFQRRPANKAEIIEWWRRWSTAGIGIITGAVSGGLMVVDRDGKDNPWPEDPDRQLDLSAALMVKTGGGGRHFYFRTEEQLGNTIGTLGHKIDTRCEGGYVVAPPSMHQSGDRYEFIGDDEIVPVSELPLPPKWLLDELKSPKKDGAAGGSEWAKLLDEGVGEGERNGMCARLAGYLIGRQLDFDVSHQILTGWNEKNDPPLPADELERTLQSIYDRELLKADDSNQMKKLISDVAQKDDKDKAKDARNMGLEALKDKFGVDLKRIRRVCGDEPYYEFHVGDAIAQVPAFKMTSFGSFKAAMAVAAEQIPEELDKTEKWSFYGNLIMAIAERVEPGQVATLRGAVEDFIDQFIAARQVYACDECQSITEPILHKDWIYINHNYLHRFIKSRSEFQSSERKLAQMLHSWGYPREQLQVTIDEKKLRPGLYKVREHKEEEWKSQQKD